MALRCQTAKLTMRRDLRGHLSQRSLGIEDGADVEQQILPPVGRTTQGQQPLPCADGKRPVRTVKRRVDFHHREPRGMAFLVTAGSAISPMAR